MSDQLITSKDCRDIAERLSGKDWVKATFEAKQALYNAADDLDLLRSQQVPWRDGKTVPQKGRLLVIREWETHLENGYFEGIVDDGSWTLDFGDYGRNIKPDNVVQWAYDDELKPAEGK